MRFANSKKNINGGTHKRRDMKNILKESFGMYVLGWKILTSYRPFGTNIFEKEWDHLIILDACRTDAITEVASEYDFIEEVDTIWSVGSTSREWIEQTFRESYRDEIRSTAYISANPFTNLLTGDRRKFEYPNAVGTYADSLSPLHRLIQERTVTADELAHIESLWVVDGDHPDDGHTSPLPKKVTDHSIKAARSGEFDRIISHYMQPHQPYFSSSLNFEELSELEKHPIAHIKKGEKEEVWDAYLDNLRFVLDDIEKLLENIDADVVITADHGELMGEMKMYGHPTGHLHPSLRKVPWIRTKGQDQRTELPDVELTGISEKTETPTKQLEALGYK